MTTTDFGPTNTYVCVACGCRIRIHSNRALNGMCGACNKTARDRTPAECTECHRMARPAARGLCMACYQRARRAKKKEGR